MSASAPDLLAENVRLRAALSRVGALAGRPLNPGESVASRLYAFLLLANSALVKLASQASGS